MKSLDRLVGRSIFGTDAGGYHSARVGYPSDLFDELFAYSGMSAPSVLEVGAGTGLATRGLLSSDAENVVALEPDAALRAQLAMHLQDARLQIEASDLLSSSFTHPFDIAACASAFHWIEAKPGLKKIRSLLRPGGSWAMWWNVYRQPGIGDAFAEALTPHLRDLNMPPSSRSEGHYAFDREFHERSLREAGFEWIEYLEFRQERSLNGKSFRALYESFSFVRILPAPDRARLLDRIEDLVVTEFGGRAPNVIACPMYLAKAPHRP